MAAKSGQYAALFEGAGSSTLAEAQAMTRVGSTSEFYITDRTKSWWDVAAGKVPVFYLDDVEISANDIAQIDYAAGYVTLRSYTSGTVTCDVYWFTPAAIGGVYGVDLNSKADTKDITTMPTTLNNPVVWKSYLKTLMDWEGTVQRHFFTGRAWVLMDCTNANSDLLWTLIEWGRPGNLRSVEYIVSGNNTALEVAYNAGTKKFTVTVATDGSGNPTSTAAQIKAHVEADAVLAALVEVTLANTTGAGVVSAKTAALMAGGADMGTDFNKIGTKILFRLYLNTTTGSLEMISGLCHLIGVPINVKLEEVQESDITLQGIGRLKYHTN